MPRNNVSKKFKDDWAARLSAFLASTMRWEVLLVFKRRGATSTRSGGARRSMSRAAQHDGMITIGIDGRDAGQGKARQGTLV